MTDSNAFGFSQFVPGFDFLKQLSQTPAASAQANHWIAPTLDPAEIEKRIHELKTVMFWLEQNSKAVAASVQALEVQLMTLKTLKGMNLSMSELAKSMQINPDTFAQKSAEQSVKKESPFSWTPKSEEAPSATSSKSKSNWPFSEDPVASKPQNPSQYGSQVPSEDNSMDSEPESPAAQDQPKVAEAASSEEKKTSSAAPDPMQWWAALSQQFQTIASKTLTDIQNAQKVQAELAAKAAAELAEKKSAEKASSKAEKKPHSAKDASSVPKPTQSSKEASTAKAKLNPKVKPKTKAKAKPKSKVKDNPVADSKSSLNQKSSVNKLLAKAEKKAVENGIANARAKKSAKVAVKPLESAAGGETVLSSPSASKQPPAQVALQSSPTQSTSKSTSKPPPKSSPKSTPKPRVNPSAFKGLDTLF